MMNNLGRETLHDLKAAGKSEAEVAWVGQTCGSARTVTWEEFVAFADRVTYNSGFGSAEIPDDLVVVFTDGSWLERAEYDGSEWWEYKKTPTRPTGDGAPLDFGRPRAIEAQK